MGEADEYDDFSQPCNDDNTTNEDSDGDDELITISEIQHEVDKL